MDFKFYTFSLDGKNENLWCIDDNQRVYLYSQYSDNTSEWILLDNKWIERLSYMTEISELSAEEYCSHKLYRTPVRMDNKKVYPSLLDIPDPQKKKIILFGFIIAAILLAIIFLVTKSENFLPFLLAMIVFGVLSIIAEKITGFEGEGEVIVIFVGIIIYVLSQVL